MREPAEYTDVPLENYRECATSTTVQALQWDGSQRQLEALCQGKPEHTPPIGSYLVQFTKPHPAASFDALAVFTPEEFHARFIKNAKSSS